MLRRLAVLLALALVAFSASRSARAEDALEPPRPAAGKLPEHRLGMAGSFAPIAALASTGGDGFMRDAKSAMGFGVSASYAARLTRHFQIGVGLGYQKFHDSDVVGDVNAHELAIPVEFGLVIPASERMEILLAGHVGFAHLWLPDQSMTERDVNSPRGTLRAIGLTAGPRIAAFFAAGSDFDLFASLEGEMLFTQATNGVSYLKNVGIRGLSIPLSVGVRKRF